MMTMGADVVTDTTTIIPEEFLCPITQEIMVDPVMSRYGQSYERTAIIEWLASGTTTCPMTRQPLLLSNVVANHRLRAQIEGWRKLHPDVVVPRRKKMRQLGRQRLRQQGGDDDNKDSDDRSDSKRDKDSDEDDDEEFFYRYDPVIGAAFLTLPPGLQCADGGTDRTMAEEDDDNDGDDLTEAVAPEDLEEQSSSGRPGHRRLPRWIPLRRRQRHS